MKLMYFDDYKLGVLKGDAVVDVSAVVQDIPHTGPHDLINGLIERFAEYRPRAGGGGGARQGHAARRACSIRPPLPRPVNIDCMAVNYMEDGTRTEPAPINAFQKSPNADHRPRRHHGAARRAGHHLRGRGRGRAWSSASGRSNVKAADAMSYVFGYVNFIDGSARGLPPPGNSFYQMKSRDTFAPIGPVHRHRRRDHAIRTSCRCGCGSTARSSRTSTPSDMAHKIPRCIEWVSSHPHARARRHRWRPAPITAA